MRLCDLTYSVRKRFRKFSICPLCFRQISDYDSFETVETQSGRYKVYTFLHTNCLNNLHHYEYAYTQLSNEVYPGVNTQEGDKNVSLANKSIETAVSPVISQGAEEVPPVS